MFPFCFSLFIQPLNTYKAVCTVILEVLSNWGHSQLNMYHHRVYNQIASLQLYEIAFRRVCDFFFFFLILKHFSMQIKLLLQTLGDGINKICFLWCFPLQQEIITSIFSLPYAFRQMEKEKPGLFSRILQSKLEPQVVDVMFILHHLASHHLTCTNISDFTHGETEIQLLQSLSLLGKKKKNRSALQKAF